MPLPASMNRSARRAVNHPFRHERACGACTLAAKGPTDAEVSAEWRRATGPTKDRSPDPRSATRSTWLLSFRHDRKRKPIARSPNGDKAGTTPADGSRLLERQSGSQSRTSARC